MRCLLSMSLIVAGKIKIGNNLLITLGAYANFDILNRSTVIGNPGG